MRTEADVALAAMTALVDGLVDGGLRHACVSPGSRSTPLALSLERHPAVRVHVHLDERSSGFFALGLAKASDSPVAVACTSGTAAAELFPAVVEASMARVPLLVLTADRPPELRGVGANQTIDQIGLYGGYVRAFVDAPVPGDDPARDTWHRRGVEVVRASRVSPPGPVHVNVPFREPLVPTPLGPAPLGPARHEPGAASARPAPDAPRQGRRTSAASVEADLSSFAGELAGVERGLVYAGGLRTGGDDVIAVADRLGWPLLAEPHSGARGPGSLAGGQLLIRADGFVASHVPEILLQIGAAPTSRAALALAGRAPRLLIVDPDELVADPLRRAAHRIVATPASLLSVLDRVEPAASQSWAGAWRGASDRARTAVDALLDGWEEPFEGRVARDVADELPDRSVLCVGSSLPIRDLDLFMRPREGVRVLANRGASGIDGFVSTTLGVAAAGEPTVALLGDLTLLHDAGALVWNGRRAHDAVLVVLNNGGGAIFSLLEQRRLPELEDLFTTPHGVDLGALVRSTGAGHVRTDRAATLVPAIRAARDAGGVHVLEVVVDAERDRRRRAEIRRVVEEAVADDGGRRKGG
jgi:2-succinyl-5-enolpyruvyl-6-hydroxy-3-cyclohexene-1-carboxylate synthase